MSGGNDVYGPLRNPREIAEFLNIGKTKTFELLASGQFRTVTVGQRKKVPQSELDRFVAEGLDKR